MTDHLDKHFDRDAAIAPASVPIAADMAENAAPNDRAYARRMGADYRYLRKSQPGSSSVEYIKIHDELVAYARRYTGGDMSRVRLLKNGSIIIVNK